MQPEPDQERIENQKEIERLKAVQKSIEHILLGFKNGKRIDIQSKKYRAAVLLANNFKKSDLEMAKSDLEYSIDIGRIFAATLDLISAFLSGWMTLWRLDLK